MKINTLIEFVEWYVKQPFCKNPYIRIDSMFNYWKMHK